MTTAERVVYTLLEYYDVGIRGEYWIQDGHVEFADGDVGDMSHVGIVIRSATIELIDLLGGDSGSSEYPGEEEIAEAIADEEFDPRDDLTLDEKVRAVIQRDYESDPQLPYYLHLINVAFSHGNLDARTFAMQYWKWVWVRGNNATVWEINPDSLKQIKSGIGEILDGEGIEPDSEGYNEIEITIGSAKTGKRYDISLVDLEAGNFDLAQTDYVAQASGPVAQVRQMDIDQQHPFYKNRPAE
jgi:hypothetical protein